MDSFRAHYADMTDPVWQPGLVARLRDHGLVTFAGITDRAALIAVARRLMTIRAHRDAAPDGVTKITGMEAAASGYAAFTDSGLIPHTDGSGVPSPPALLLLACVQPADEGGATQVVDGARIISALAGNPAALRSLSAPRAAYFGGAGGYLGSVFEPAGPGRIRIRLRLDDLVQFSADAAAAIPLLRTVISQHLTTMHLGSGDGLLLCNTRWLHGRDRFGGRRIMLRILGDPLPGTGILPGFPAPGTPSLTCLESPDNPGADSLACRIA